jgi:hypothetical protein
MSSTGTHALAALAAPRLFGLLRPQGPVMSDCLMRIATLVTVAAWTIALSSPPALG